MKNKLLVLVFVCVVLLLFAIDFRLTRPYYAGKYGKKCYQVAPSIIKHELKFFTLEDCLEFVGK